jgi:hypothetical protein
VLSIKNTIPNFPNASEGSISLKEMATHANKLIPSREYFLTKSGILGNGYNTLRPWHIFFNIVR